MKRAKRRDPRKWVRRHKALIERAIQQARKIGFPLRRKDVRECNYSTQIDVAVRGVRVVSYASFHSYNGRVTTNPMTVEQFIVSLATRYLRFIETEKA